MATADGTRLIARLQAAIKIAEESPIVLADVALDTIADVKANAAARLTGQEYQVGFDLDQFQENISRPGRLHVPAPGVGVIGILDVEEMGTAEDFEAIGSIPGLFHQHTGDTHGTWRNIVYPDPALRDEVEDARVYGGIHFRFADRAGRKQGEHIAQWAHGHFFQPVE